MSELQPSDVIKLVMLSVMLLLLLCVVVVVCKELFLQRFMQVLRRARGSARHHFFDQGLGYKYTLGQYFGDCDEIKEKAAIWVLYQVYASWSYRSAHRVCLDFKLAWRDLEKEIQSVSNKVNKDIKEKERKSDKNPKYAFCEHGKSCEYKDICNRASPIDSRLAESDYGCHRINEMIKFVEYEPTTNNPHIRCAAAIKGDCDYRECKHFDNHVVSDACFRPAREGECPLRRHSSSRYCDIESLVHCIVTDSSVEINLAFKRKKNHGSR